MVGWPVLMLLRARRRGLDWVEAALCALVTAYTLPSQRFLGVYALVAAPYLARDLEERVGVVRWPRWTTSPAARAALASAACVLIGVPEWGRRVLTPGVGVALERFPVAACDFMERHGVRGRGFEHFRFVGYQAWRFWPDRGRLPFMDIHQSGTPDDRAAFARAFIEPGSWPAFASRYRLDYSLLDRRQRSGVELLNVMDADSSWALVFFDDAAALYVNRTTLRAQADSFGFHVLGAGERRLTLIAEDAARDTAMRSDVRSELERAAQASRWNATAGKLLADLDMIDGHADEARRRLLGALRVDPELPGAHRRLAVLALYQHEPRRAIAEFERERALDPEAPGLELGLGMAYEQAGDLSGARREYQRMLERYPANAVARARLDSLSARSR